MHIVKIHIGSKGKLAFSFTVIINRNKIRSTSGNSVGGNGPVLILEKRQSGSYPVENIRMQTDRLHIGRLTEL
ncbi:hypothetical protein D3C81_2200000 [compost metagenome]